MKKTDTPVNRAKFMDELEKVDWCSILNTRINDDPQANYDIFIDAILKIKP